MVLAVGAEWYGARALLHASVAASMRVLEPGVAERPDLAEGMFLLLQAITKKKPQFLDWLDDLLPDVIDLGKKHIFFITHSHSNHCSVTVANIRYFCSFKFCYHKPE